ncbi:hypothetical protein [Ectobacillus panaciterrae]|nr:hypothetical protein [Ectobacillus panaciterrae]
MLHKIAEAATLPHESIRLMGAITSEQVIEAMRAVEQFSFLYKKNKAPSQ